MFLSCYDEAFRNTGIIPRPGNPNGYRPGIIPVVPNGGLNSKCHIPSLRGTLTTGKNILTRGGGDCNAGIHYKNLIRFEFFMQYFPCPA
jgi:hypothetical protein